MFIGVALIYVCMAFSRYGDFFFAGAEKQAYAPQTRKSYHGIDYTAGKCALASEYPGNKVKLEYTDKAPVDTADY